MIAGLVAVLYPFVEDSLNNFLDYQILQHYQRKTAAKEEKERQANYEKMIEENKRLAEEESVPGDDPFANPPKEEKEPSVDYYAEHTIGVVKIPKIGIELPIFDGTNDLFLSRGAGLLGGTSFPVGGENTHTVISAHRGLPEATLFTNLPKVKVGDRFFIENQEEILAYQVDNVKIIEPTYLEDLRIVPGADRATLMTCTPYMINSHRLLVQGFRVPYVPEMTKEIKTGKQQQRLRHYLMIGGSISLFLLVSYIIIHRIRVMMIRRRRYELAFLFVDHDNKPLANERFTLYSKNGKREMKRSGVVYQVYSDDEGRVCFTNLPGASYQVRQKNWGLKVKVKKIADEYLTPTKNKKVQIIPNQPFQITKP